jgi:TPR repeat protein
MDAAVISDRSPSGHGGFTIIFHTPGGDVVRNTHWKTYVRLKILAIAGVFFGIGLLILNGPDVEAWEKRREIDARRPVMEKLANEGKVEAALWMIQNYPRESEDRMAQLASRGYALALFYQGLLLLHNKDRVDDADGLRVIQQAAEQGYLPAMLFLEQR